MMPGHGTGMVHDFTGLLGWFSGALNLVRPGQTRVAHQSPGIIHSSGFEAGLMRPCRPIPAWAASVPSEKGAEKPASKTWRRLATEACGWSWMGAGPA